MNGNSPHSGAPIFWNDAGSPSKTNFMSTSSRHGTARISTTVRRSRRICHSTRAAVAVVARELTPRRP